MNRFLMFLVLMSFAAFGQKVETLAGNEYAFGGPAVKVSSILGQTAVLMGGEGAMIVNHTFGFGGAGYGAITEIKQTDNAEHKKLHFGYGGVKFYYVNNYDKLFHFTASLLLGGGGVSEETENNESTEEKHGIFIAIPSLGAEMNVTNYFRMELNAEYQFVTGIDSENYSNKDFSGLVVSLFFKFGRF